MPQDDILNFHDTPAFVGKSGALYLSTPATKKESFTRYPSVEDYNNRTPRVAISFVSAKEALADFERAVDWDVVERVVRDSRG